MSHYHHLSIFERESIWENKLLGKSLREIARITGRSVSTVSRELKRNRYARSYRPSKAQEKYQKRRKHCRRHKVLEQTDIKEKVVTLLTGQQWSPEQISMRLELEHGRPVVSYSTIYRAIKTGYMEPKERKKKKDGHYFMERYLRRKGWRGKKKEKQEKAYIHRGIEERPKSAENRSRFGHFEGDLVYSSCHKLYIVTLVDRRSRFLLTGISKTRKASEVAQVMASMLEKLPNRLLRSITLDRGFEFAKHADITAKIPNAQFYFAHPMCPWERGTNENTNGLLRQYVPKNTYKVPFSPELLEEFTHKLNTRPRKCLGWKTPAEVFHRQVLHLT